ncbi:PaaI family thioesterase [Caldimonas brevitalea]|uniref:Thioesterase n=1 Tax=Caldimonas brevitalea TaxID=413882 RepID=A0A0G3BU91_9BURK|nr:PaaI family thioesterase [Caldimonas brevitalea]AKJ30931.1 thioesterase [Caldimonas brevitalea]
MHDDTTVVSRQALEQAIERSPFTRWAGTRLGHYAAGEVEIEIDVRPEMAQHHGFVHGALVGYLADTACAWAAASTVGDVVTSEYKLNFLAPARGEHLRAVGQVIKSGSRQVVVRADVYCRQAGSEKIVATALATIARV